MKNIMLISVLLAAILLSSPIVADGIKGKAVCKKLKACVMETLESQDFPDRMKETIMVQLDQCEIKIDNKQKALIEADLVDQANACADDMIDMPCQQLMTPNGANQSKTCLEFNQASEAAGIEDS